MAVNSFDSSVMLNLDPICVSIISGESNMLPITKKSFLSHNPENHHELNSETGHIF